MLFWSFFFWAGFVIHLHAGFFNIACQHVSVKVYMVINVLQLLCRTKLKELQLPSLFSMFAG